MKGLKFCHDHTVLPAATSAAPQAGTERQPLARRLKDHCAWLSDRRESGVVRQQQQAMQHAGQAAWD